MKPPSNVKTPAQYIASLSANRAKTIAAVRALVNKHIPRGYDECLVWGTIGWTIPLSRYPDTYNKQPICYVALSSQKNYCSLYLMGAFWSAAQLEQLKAAFKAAGKKLDMGKCCVHFETPDLRAARTYAILTALPLASFRTCGDTLRSERGRIHETSIERQDASAIHRLTPRRSCEDDRDGAGTREQAHSARLR